MNLIDCMIDEFQDEAKIAQMEDREVTCWIEGIFFFSLTWSIGGSSDQNSRVKFDQLVRELMEVGSYIYWLCSTNLTCSE
jgi:dynein heavy chain